MMCQRVDVHSDPVQVSWLQPFMDYLVASLKTTSWWHKHQEYWAVQKGMLLEKSHVNEIKFLIPLGQQVLEMLDH